MGAGYISLLIVTAPGLTCRAPRALTTAAARWGRAAGTAGTDRAKPVSRAAGSPAEGSPGAEEAKELSCVS